MHPIAGQSDGACLADAADACAVWSIKVNGELRPHVADAIDANRSAVNSRATASGSRRTDPDTCGLVYIAATINRHVAAACIDGCLNINRRANCVGIDVDIAASGGK